MAADLADKGPGFGLGLHVGLPEVGGLGVDNPGQWLRQRSGHNTNSQILFADLSVLVRQFGELSHL